MKFNIRLLYLYLFSFVGLLIVVIGSIQMVDLGLKAFVFRNADTYISYPMPKALDPVDQVAQPSEEELERYQRQQSKSDRERQISNSIAMILIGVPLYFYHWKTIQKENQKEFV
ncbi:hypothetical protein HYV31_01090 [candidate division WWE3 bacterium]|nr:hypothetical protein [candidate division WWE3 bacterium]